MQHQLEQNTPTWQPGDLVACIRRKENRMPIKHPYFSATYEPLRQISIAILRNEGASLYKTQQEAEGILFDGSWLWEEYLWTLLKPLGFNHPQNKKEAEAWKPLPEITFYPDFFHKTKRLILDAKYKRERVSQDDAKQLFSYMFLLDAVHGGLIKPQGEKGKPAQVINRQGGGATYWHDYVLPPPSGSNVNEFLSKMEALEKEFEADISSLVLEEGGP